MLSENLAEIPALMIRQRFEAAELLGIETPNKYSIETEAGESLAFAAQQQGGLLGFLSGAFLGHRRTFDIYFRDSRRTLLFQARNLFRLYFRRMEVRGPEGELWGAIQQRFSPFGRRFEVEDSLGQNLLTMKSPFWRVWSFPILKGEREVAVVTKKWPGKFTEWITDQDTFRVEFRDPALSVQERQLILTVGVFVDLLFFERSP